ncbi:hypothetical protein AAFF_G00205940 [Aldrovandia affinis]|uniref:Uncharacterized protein n=1 Tax=Aldrovandia affinis TaxID=143900 RepID=A0AAD7W4V5_9TELE|nr:hypothetical protein AAFF_G00205940 [Aldrovandia affinis]
MREVATRPALVGCPKPRSRVLVTRSVSTGRGGMCVGIRAAPSQWLRSHAVREKCVAVNNLRLTIAVLLKREALHKARSCSPFKPGQRPSVRGCLSPRAPGVGEQGFYLAQRTGL